MEYINQSNRNGNIVSKDYKNVKANSKEEWSVFVNVGGFVTMVCRCRSNCFWDIDDKKYISRK